MKRMVAFVLCLGILFLLTGCAEKPAESRRVYGEILYIADLSKDEYIEQDGYIIYVYGYVGDLIKVWVNEETILNDSGSDISWEDVLSKKQTGIFFKGTAVPVDEIDDDKLHNLFKAEELTLGTSNTDAGGKDDE
jgi:hypothetical protein